MAYGATESRPDSPSTSVEGLLLMLRSDLVGELQAINQYQEHIDAMADPNARQTLEHIRDDEKEHVAELTKLIQQLDPTQKAKFEREGL